MEENSLKPIGKAILENLRGQTTATIPSQKGKADTAEEERNLCKDCTGVPCLKPYRKYKIPTVLGEGDEIRIAYSWCKYKPRKTPYRRALIPNKYVGKTFDDYQVMPENKVAVEGARWFVTKQPTRGLYLFGEVGTGKTFLAALIAQEYVGKGKSVIFGDVPSLLADLKATFGKGGTEDLLDRYCKCDLLILDDIGAGKVTDWNVGILYQIVNARYNADKLTVATSNCDLKGLEDVLTVRDSYGRIIDALTGKRIVSRLKGMTYPLLLEGNDRRS